MIGSLRGEILERDLGGSVLIEVAGVGYVVHVSQRALAELEPGTAAFLHIHHHIREADQQLYGFQSRDERAIPLLTRANFIAASIASAPELQRKNRFKLPGVSCASRASSMVLPDPALPITARTPCPPSVRGSVMLSSMSIPADLMTSAIRSKASA